MKSSDPIGSSLDEFLKEEGVLEEVEEVSVKRVLVFQIEQEMKRQNIDKSDFAESMPTSRSAVDCVWNP